MKAIPGGARWDERIARARSLAETRPAAAEALTFYAALAEYQKSLVTYVARPGLGAATPASPGSARSFIEALDLDPVLAAIPAFLSWLPRVAPARLAESAAEMYELDRERWRQSLRSYLEPFSLPRTEESARITGDSAEFQRVARDKQVRTALAGDGPDLRDDDRPLVFVMEALLQPFAERAATHSAISPQERSSARCPVCGVLPVVGALREEGQGAKRTLVCALCLTEREYLRVVCPNCGEQQFDILPVYTADRFEYVRIEACDRCRCYLKTIDLTKDGLAVPLVDDIASLSLDLWARDRGYVRVRANILGI